MRWFNGVGLALLVAVTGCKAEYDHTDITGARASSSFAGSVDRTKINVTAGQIVTAHIVSYNDDNNIMTMSLRSSRPDLVEVVNVVSDHDFAFIGIAPGVADVDILADNEVVLVISAVVTPQPNP